MRHQAVTIHDRRKVGDGHVLAFGLIDILRLAETDVESSSWRCSDVDGGGELMEELDHVSSGNAVISGAEMLRLAGGVYQMIDGDFEAYRPDEPRHWLVIRAIDSSEYVVSTDNERLLARVRERFCDVRDSPMDAE